MVIRLSRTSPWLTLLGTVTLLVGLAWDAILHRRDRDLAAQEGIFTLGNPGHALFAIGLALVCAGMVLFLLGRALERPGLSTLRRTALVAPVAALVALSGLTLLVAMSSDSALAGGHSHDHGSSDAANQATPVAGEEHDHADEHDHDHGSAESDAVNATPEEQAAADALLAGTVAGTARFADFSVAEAEGYRLITPDRPGRANIGHYLNVSYATDGAILDPERPEALMYWRTRDGEMILIGAMFAAPRGEGPDVGGPLTEWHSHDNGCYDPATQVFRLADAEGTCPVGSNPVMTGDMMHVWLFDHPRGPFAHDLGLDGFTAAYEELVANL